MNIFLHKYITNTQVEGPGKRFALWFQGCSIHCKGCMLPNTWTFTKSQKISCGHLVGKIINTPSIEGVTILGGEPFDQPQALSCLMKQIKKYSDLSIMLFSGYTIQHLKLHCPQFEQIIKRTDIFIEGPFIKEQTSFSRPWAGSSNQLIHFLTDRYTIDNLNIPAQKIELRIPKEGEITINGMLPEEKLWTIYEAIINKEGI